MAAITLRPFDIITIDGLAGPYVGGTTGFGIVWGGNLGIKMGPGSLIGTFRFGQAIGDDTKDEDGDMDTIFTVGIGYKYELFTR
jgi:hypothetical protein